MPMQQQKGKITSVRDQLKSQPY